MEARQQMGFGNNGAALAVQVVGGLVWLGTVYELVRGAAGHTLAVVWAACSLLLWLRMASELDSQTDPSRVWAVAGRWYLEALVAPVAAVYYVLARAGATAREAPNGRIDALEQRLVTVEAELAKLRSEPAKPPVPAAEPVRTELPPRPAPRPPAAEPRVRAPQVELSDLLGARTLAWAGGVVTLLGIVLLFGMAVSRGWIGPVARVGIGAFASASIFLAGVWLQRRFGTTYSALAAVGAGIAGGYSSLLAAAALYHLLPAPVALALAALIAAVGLATSLVWSSELVAGLGLIGAMLVPVVVLFEDDLTVLGTSFVALILAAAGVVGVVRHWRSLLVAAALVSVPQIALLILEGRQGSPPATALAVVFAAIYVAIGLGAQISRGRPGLDAFTATFMLGGSVVAGASMLVLYDGTARGTALLAAAAPLALAGAYFFTRRDRDVGSFLAVLALALTAVGVAALLSGPTLAIAWAAEAASLAWLAGRTKEVRFQLTALAYGALAAVHALAVDAPPARLLDVSSHPAAGIAAVLAAAAAFAIAAIYAGRRVRVGLASVAWVLAAYAAGQAILELLGRLVTGETTAFDWGQVAITAVYAAAAPVALAVAGRRRLRELEVASLAWGGVVLAKLVFDIARLPAEQRSYAALAAAAGAFTLALVNRSALRGRALDPVTAAAAAIAAGLGCWAAVVLVGGHGLGGAPEGAALLAIAGAYAAATAFVLERDRDFATLLWSLGLAIAIGASVDLVSGTWLVLTWAVAAATFATLAGALRDERFVAGAVALTGLALVHTLRYEAPPSHLFLSNSHPASGVPAILCTAAALAFAARAARASEPLFTRLGLWLAGAAVVYGASLGVLEIAETLGRGDTSSNFQHGHTAVSALWGALGLAVLYAGLKRRYRALRLAGFALFGVSLAKLFLYDLSALSSLTRALSFLAVGVVLLLGGFFYQRLAADWDEQTA